MSCGIPVRPKPIGTNEPLAIDRQPIWRVYTGDAISLRLRLTLPETGEPVTPDNSIVRFVLSDQRFSPETCAIWEGLWRDGILEVNHTEHPGLVEIKVPMAISNDLRRGSLLYSVSVSNKLGEHKRTVVEGTLLIEYAPTSPIHNIPYKDDVPCS